MQLPWNWNEAFWVYNCANFVPFTKLTCDLTCITCDFVCTMSLWKCKSVNPPIFPISILIQAKVKDGVVA